MDGLNLGLGEQTSAPSAAPTIDSTASTPQNAPAPDPFGQADAATSIPGTNTDSESPPQLGDDQSSFTTENTDTDSTDKPPAEMTAEEVQALADDPRTPAPLRARLNAGLKYAEQFKAEKLEIQSKYDALHTQAEQFEGKSPLPQAEVERLREAENRLFEIQSFSATPDDVDKFIRETNPAVYKEYQNKAAWNALYTENGTPDLENWQAVVDKGLGYDPKNPNATRVLAEDVIKAAEALRDGRITGEDLHEFSSDAEYRAYQRQVEAENNARVRDEQLKAQTEFQETQIRASEIENVRSNIRSEIVPALERSIEKFRLNPTKEDPKVLREYKESINEKINNLFNQESRENRSLTELQKAIDIVGKARGLTPQQAQAEVRGLLENPQYKRHLASGVSDFMDKAEKLLAKEAYMFRLLAQGYEVDNAKGQKARAVIGNPNQATANLPSFSAEELARMNGGERQNALLERLSQQLRQGEPNRLGG